MVRPLAIRPDAEANAVHVRSVPPVPRVGAFGLVQLGRLWAQPGHQHAKAELHYVRRGRGSLTVAGRTRAIAPGSTYLCRPGEVHGGTADPNDPPLVFYCSLELPSAVQAAIASQEAPVLLAPPAPVGLRAALRASADALAEQGQEAPTLGAALLRVCAEVQLLASPVGRLSAAPQERALSAQALRMLDLSACPPQLAAVARELHVSPQHLGRVIARTAGSPWPRLVASHRVHLAQRLIQDRHRSLRSVAQQVGLSGERALARLFRRITGLSPRQFRDAVGQSGPVPVHLRPVPPG